MLILIVRLVEYASDGYISSAIAKISNYMNLTEPVAGATLLAFSNGASDVITALVASSAEGSDSLVMGSLFGASIFTMLTCMGIIILATAGQTVTDLQKIRFPAIISTYVLAVVLLVCIGGFQVPYLVLGSIFVVVYVVYILIVHYQDVTQTKSKLQGLKRQLTLLEDEQDPCPQAKESLESEIRETINRPRRKSGSFTKDEWLRSITQIPADAPAYVKIMNKVYHQMDKSFSSRSFPSQCFYLMELLPHLCIRLTLPPVDHPLLFKGQQYIYPFTSVTFMVWAEGYLTQTFTLAGVEVAGWMLSLPFSLLLCVLVMMFSQHRYKPTPRGLFLALTTITGMVWLDVLVNIAIDVIAYIQLTTGASDLYLGMTLLGVGNSCIDLFVNYTLARKGFQTMAITGIFSGQMFNLLIGFGLSCLIRGFRNSSSTYHVFDWDKITGQKTGLMVLIIFTTCLATLAFFGTSLKVLKFTFGKRIAYASLLAYLVFLGTFTALEIGWKSDQNQ